MLGSILITGGTGSYGRAFTRRLLTQNLSGRICIFSRGEHAQAQMRHDLGDDSRLRFFIGDVRDQPRLKRAMRGVDVVVHAAALKRIEVGAYSPLEMTKTNVGGAINVIEASEDAGVKKVVALSTDKAASPISPYGHSKALAEALFIAANDSVSASGPRFSCCRYGNIWASAGSVVPVWRGLIEAGARAVPVTNPDATRYWMDIEQAVDLVLDTIETMRGGELVIPENLPAYRLGDLAQAMGVQMIVKGMPSYEKLHESLTLDETSDKAPRMSVADLRGKLASIGFHPAMENAA